MPAPPLAKILSAELEGIDAQLIEVETDLHPGIHAFTIVGLADKALSESKERINAALKNSGAKPPNRDNRRVIVNLAPADIKKTGSQYDVAIAVGYLLASGQLKQFPVEQYLFIGELALDGSLRAIAGAMNIARLAVKKQLPCLVVPFANAAEAALVAGVQVFAARNLSELIAHLEAVQPLAPIEPTPLATAAAPAISIADIKGQEHAKRALLIAAAGNHNLLMVGSPGSGKTMLAQAIASILPPPSYDEVIEITQIYSAAGALGSQPYINERPFRAPHQTASSVALIGGGQIPRPGEISLAHRGILFLDELPEFRRDVLEALRQPLENGRVTVSRVRSAITFPAQFMLTAAMNPCPCGYYGDDQKACTCSPYDVVRYQKKISGPLLDRIDLQIVVPRVSLQELTSESLAAETQQARAQVARARKRQEQRLSGVGVLTNSEIKSRDVRTLLQLEPDAAELLSALFSRSMLSARGYYRVLRVAQTIADLDGADRISKKAIAEAFSYRLRERQQAQ